jgi:hypothetical protein
MKGVAIDNHQLDGLAGDNALDGAILDGDDDSRQQACGH